jgi:hypothetical protein
VEPTKPVAGGMPEKASQLVRVTKPTGNDAFAVISAGNITAAAHLIPDEPISSSKPPSTWTVNSHIDLDTWNEVYYLLDKDLQAQMVKV